jgi:histidyl-tRNA synthetase
MRFGTPRGTRDFLPPEMRVRRFIMETVRRVFEEHGFEEMDTPVLELWDVLSAKGGDEVERQTYRFQDKSERWLGLRFDLTVPLARVVASTPDLAKPFKRYYISKAWRYEEPQRGRFREFVQADVDIIGSPKVEADIECVSTAVSALTALGLEGFEVRMNDRKLLGGMVESLGLAGEREAGVFRTLDKLDKIGEGAVGEELSRQGLDSETVSRVIGFTRLRGEEALEYAGCEFGSSPMTGEGVAELRRLMELAEPYRLAGALSVDLSLVRGLDYYTGPVFEIRAGKGEIGSVAGGGRYDRLVDKLGGAPTPATGISLGIERLYETLFGGISSRLDASSCRVYVANVNDATAKDAVRVSRELIAKGVAAEADIMGRKLGRQLEYADSRGIPFALIIGPEEIRTGKLKLKDMRKKSESILGIDEIIQAVRKA